MTEQDVLEMCRECQIPEHMHSGIVDYVVRSVPPGSFMLAVLENDLVGAAARADHINIQHLANYAALLYQLPRNCWGDVNTVNDWLLKGIAGVSG